MSKKISNPPPPKGLIKPPPPPCPPRPPSYEERMPTIDELIKWLERKHMRHARQARADRCGNRLAHPGGDMSYRGTPYFDMATDAGYRGEEREQMAQALEEEHRRECERKQLREAEKRAEQQQLEDEIRKESGREYTDD